MNEEEAASIPRTLQEVLGEELLDSAALPIRSSFRLLPISLGHTNGNTLAGLALQAGICAK